MSVTDLVEAYLAGKEPTVPTELREEFERAIAAHNALNRALGETVVAPERAGEDRGAPLLPQDYEVVRELGRGGMGVVYLARQRSLGRFVAVKVLRPGEIAFGPLVRRFVEEARHLARLRHPNIVSVHETGQAGDEPYFTMDYIEGESLHAVIKRGPLSPTQAVRVLKQACEGVEHAHSQGIIHRDLKPANILIDRVGRAYVTDFGLARDVRGTSELTGSGDILGTPAYMAPEQALGQVERIGEATDVHALGVILYEMLTGRPPYGHGAPAEVLLKLLREEPVPPRRIDRRVPRDLETICLKAMSKEPERRYASVHALLEDLRRYEAGEPVLARRPGVASRVVRFAARHRVVFATAALVAAIVVGVSYFVVVPRALASQSHERDLETAKTLHRQGDPLGAVRVLQGLYDRSDEMHREGVLCYMIGYAADVGEADGALEAWQRVLACAPHDAIFGEGDWYCAKALTDEWKARSKNGVQSRSRERADAELCLKRIEVLLSQPCTEAHRRRAEADKAVLEGFLRAPGMTVTEDAILAEPRGTEEELKRIARDDSARAWRRGRAFMALGRSQEERGDKDAARESYQRGFDLLRRSAGVYETVHPVPDDASGSEGEKRVCEARQDGEPCEALKGAQEALRRLDPAAPNLLRGGVVLRVDDPPRELNLQVWMDLCDPEFPDGMTARGFLSSGLAAEFSKDGVARVGVADGRYRFRVEDHSSPADEKDLAASRLYELETGDLPKEIEMDGRWVTLPSIHFRRRTEIKLLDPVEGKKVDLRSQVFHWTAVPGATKYSIGVGITRQGVSSEGSGTLYLGTDVAQNLACLKDVNESGKSRPYGSLATGLAATWQIRAYDEHGKCIGVSPEGSFFIDHGLEEGK